MKKIIAVLLTLAFVLCPLLAAADEETAIDAASYARYTHLIFEANTLGALFSRHTSVTYAVEEPMTSAYGGMVWETAEAVFSSWAPESALYDRDGISYILEPDEETDRAKLSCRVMFDSAYDPYYRVLGASETEAFDNEHEHPTGGFERDGRLHLFSEKDEALSQRQIADLGLEYADQLFTTELVADAVTYEILTLTVRMRQGEEEQVIWRCTAEYDTPEPLASHTLRAAFERSDDSMVDVTYVVDPGTKGEQTKTAAVPVGTETVYSVGDVPSVCFSDRDAATLIPWDGISDVSWYVFTNPGKELTAKHNALYFARLMEEDPEAYKQQIMAAIVEVNDIGALLQNHRSAYCEVKWPILEKGDMVSYRENSLYFEAKADYAMLVDDQGKWYDDDPTGTEKKVSCTFYAMTDEEWSDKLSTLLGPGFLDEEITRAEQVVKAVDNGDGTLTVTTYVSAEDVPDKGYPEELKGLPLESAYIVDAQTLELRAVTRSLVRGEVRIPASIAIVTLDAAHPAGMDKLRALRQEARNPAPDKAWTVTVIYDSGTASEQRFSLRLDQSARLYLSFRDGYDALYKEAVEGTNDWNVYAGPVTSPAA